MAPLAAVDVAKLVYAAGWRGWACVTAVQVAWAESGLDPHAVNVVDVPVRPDGSPNPAFPSLDLGLFQINTYWWPALSVRDALTPETNAVHAYKMWAGSFNAAPERPWTVRIQKAWSLWVVYTTGAHRKYETVAIEACRAAGIKVS